MNPAQVPVGIDFQRDFVAAVAAQPSTHDHPTGAHWGWCSLTVKNPPDRGDTMSADFTAPDHNPRDDKEDKRRDVVATIVPSDLSGRSFRFADFSFARLPRTDLRGVDAAGARFDNALLERAQFDSFRTNLLAAQFNEASLRGADFEEARMPLASLRGAKLRGAKMYRTKMHGADLSSADLRGAYLVEADLPTADLSSADLTGAHLGDADLRVAILDSSTMVVANLTVTDLRGASLQRADLTGARLLSLAIDGADFTEASLRLNLLDISEESWGAKELAKFLADMRGAGLYGLGLARLDREKRTLRLLPKQPFRPSDCGGSPESAIAYGCIDLDEDTPARSHFAQRFLNYWADTACLPGQDPEVASSLAYSVGHRHIKFWV